MKRKRLVARTLTVIGLALAVGCGQTSFDAALAPSLEDVDDIRNDNSLEPQEKRDALTDLGIDAVTINGLLESERLANQFGGDLSSAYDKVVGEQFSEMTPDEVQVYGDATGRATYSDAEAQAIVDLFNEQNIDSPSELQALLDDPLFALPTAIGESPLIAVFITTSPDSVRDELP
jgi:hypothetical protein